MQAWGFLDRILERQGIALLQWLRDWIAYGHISCMIKDEFFV